MVFADNVGGVVGVIVLIPVFKSGNVPKSAILVPTLLSVLVEYNSKTISDGDKEPPFVTALTNILNEDKLQSRCT